MKLIEAIKTLQKCVENQSITSEKYEEIRSFAFDEEKKNTVGTIEGANLTLDKLHSFNILDDTTYRTLKDHVNRTNLEFYEIKESSQIPQEIPQPEPQNIESEKENNIVFKGPFVGFAMTLILTIMGVILMIFFGDKKAKTASYITIGVELAIPVLIFIILFIIMLIDPNIIFPGGL